MSTPSVGSESQGDQGGGVGPEAPPDVSEIEFDTIFNNRDPEGVEFTIPDSRGIETRHRGE